MKKFEYKEVSVIADGFGCKLMSELNELGAEGWEIIAVTLKNIHVNRALSNKYTSHVILLKREISNE